LESQIEDNKKLSHQLKEFKEELAITKETNETLNILRANMEERKKIKEEKNEKKGFLGWFSKGKE
jgi:hypothetical protein